MSPSPRGGGGGGSRLWTPNRGSPGEDSPLRRPLGQEGGFPGSGKGGRGLPREDRSRERPPARKGGGSPRPGWEGRGRRGATNRRRALSVSDIPRNWDRASGTSKLGPAPTGGSASAASRSATNLRRRRWAAPGRFRRRLLGGWVGGPSLPGGWGDVPGKPLAAEPPIKPAVLLRATRGGAGRPGGAHPEKEEQRRRSGQRPARVWVGELWASGGAMVGDLPGNFIPMGPPGGSGGRAVASCPGSASCRRHHSGRISASTSSSSSSRGRVASK